MEEMKLNQQKDSAEALRSQLAAGVPLADAASRLVRLQPAYADFWLGASRAMQNGRPLSEALETVWPKASVSAVRAGEANGSLLGVLENLVKSIQIQREVYAEASKMIYPLLIIAAAMLTFVIFMMTIVPSVTASLQRAAGKVGELDGFAGIGLKARHFVLDQWLLVAVVGIAVVAGVVTWARAPNTRRDVVRLLMKTPMFGPALKDLCFGLWSSYMAMSCGAGLSTVDSLRTTVDVLPEPLQGGVRALVHDLAVRNVGLEEAADPERQAEGDERRLWPYYVPHAFSIGERSGRIDVELARVSPELITSGKAGMKRALMVANLVAMVISASTLGATMILVYLPMMNGMSHLR